MESMILNIVKCLKNSGVVVIPTDTLYALTCDATCDEAVKKIFAIKHRDISKPLPILVRDIDEAMKFIKLNKKAEILAKKFWPGSLTIVGELKAVSGLSKVLNIGKTTIAIRVPNNAVCLSVLKEVSFPIIGTSANLSGDKNCDVLAEVKEVFDGVVDYIHPEELASKDPKPSTIIECMDEEIKIARYGAISENEINEALSC